MIETKINTIILNDTSVDQHYGCLAVMSALLDLCSINRLKVLRSFPLGYKYSNSEEYKRCLNCCPLVIINGEGTLHHNAYNGLELLRAARQAKSFGCPVVLINATWENNGREAADLMAYVDLVFVRDVASALELKSLGINASVVPDLSFAFVASSKQYADTSAYKLTQSDSVSRTQNIILYDIWRKSKGDLIPILYMHKGQSRWKFLRSALSKMGNEIIYENFINWRFRSAQSSYLLHSIDQYLESLSKSKLHVTGRYHACTMSAALGVPFIGIHSNTRKIQNLVDDIGLNPERASESLSISQINEFLNNGWTSEERESLSKYISAASKDTKSAFEQIFSLGLRFLN